MGTHACGSHTVLLSLQTFLWDLGHSLFNLVLPSGPPGAAASSKSSLLQGKCSIIPVLMFLVSRCSFSKNSTYTDSFSTGIRLNAYTKLRRGRPSPALEEPKVQQGRPPGGGLPRPPHCGFARAPAALPVPSPPPSSDLE